MPDQTKLILLIILILIAIVIVILLVNNAKKTSLKNQIDNLHIQLNQIKTIPLAFKINKAQAIAKRNQETAEKVKVYYEKYEQAQKNIDEISSQIETIEDEFANKNYSIARKELSEAIEKISISETEVNEIDKFLEKFSEEETILRDNSSKLKEKFRRLKLNANDNANALSISYEGIEKKIEKVEDLFSTSEELIYINDYAGAKKTLIEINEAMNDIANCIKELPDLVAEAKGVLPALLDETSRQYALSRQRGVFTEHLNIDKQVKEIEASLAKDTKVLSEGNLTDVKDNIEEYKNRLNALLASMNDENEDFQALKTKNDDITNSINELNKLHNYVLKAYQKDKERFGIENIDTYLDETLINIDNYKDQAIGISEDINENNLPASQIMNKANILAANIDECKTSLINYKAAFDKNTTDEQRAKAQLMKLQVVINEVEVKVLEYHLPAIADSYKDDLIKSREMIAKIKELLDEVPLNLDELNNTLNESIDFISTFYNNVNNVVGMAIMVENAIVFGNKYRSSHPEVERDLSRAELSYLNGEYTKALTMAIACMEKLFPNRQSSNYLENA